MRGPESNAEPGEFDPPDEEGLGVEKFMERLDTAQQRAFESLQGIVGAEEALKLVIEYEPNEPNGVISAKLEVLSQVLRYIEEN